MPSPGPGSAPAPAAPAKGQVRGREGFAHEVAIVGTLQVANAGHAGREMPAGSGQQRRLANLTS